MSNKVKEQILAIRNSGVVNMFDISGVLQEAQKQGYTLLLLFLSTQKDKYLDFIWKGESNEQII